MFADGTGRFVHGLTYSGTPSSCFTGLQVYQIMQRENLFARPGEIGGVLRMKLQGLAGKHSVIGEIRGRGLLIGLEFVKDRATRQPFPAKFSFTARLVEALRQRDVLVGAGSPLSNHGRDGDHIQISPPYIISESEIATLVDALDDALGDVARQAREANA